MEDATDVEALFPSRFRKEVYPESYGRSASCIGGRGTRRKVGTKLRERNRIKNKWIILNSNSNNNKLKRGKTNFW